MYIFLISCQKIDSLRHAYVRKGGKECTSRKEICNKNVKMKGKKYAFFLRDKLMKKMKDQMHNHNVSLMSE